MKNKLIKVVGGIIFNENKILICQRKQDNETAAKATYVNADKILGALKGLSKEKNFRYKQKKEYNIRNNIKPWEKNGR